MLKEKQFSLTLMGGPVLGFRGSYVHPGGTATWLVGEGGEKVERRYIEERNR